VPKPPKFEEAIKATKGRKVEPPDVYYNQRVGAARAEAFSIAGIASMDQLQQTLDSLREAQEQGASFKKWKEELLKAPDVLALTNHRLDNIFRTNIQGAYARGRAEHHQRHKERRPYLMYSAINDSRTRPRHAAMHGFVAPVDDPVWDEWTPPCGYRCRCTVISLSETQARRRQEQDRDRQAASQEAQEARINALSGGPDAGWNYHPGHAQFEGLRRALDHRATSPKYSPELRDKAQKELERVNRTGEALGTRIAEAERYVKNGMEADNLERLVAIDLDSMEELTRKAGDPGRVSTQAVRAELDDPLRSILLTHSHSTGRSFTAADLRNAARPGTFSVHILGPENSRFSAISLLDDPAAMFRLHDDAQRQAWKVYQRYVRAGAITREAAADLLQHTANTALASAGAILHAQLLSNSHKATLDEHREIFEEAVEAASRSAAEKLK
jgi:SPP1 gp7 family putative phage head morphogenesis protein